MNCSKAARSEIVMKLRSIVVYTIVALTAMSCSKASGKSTRQYLESGDSFLAKKDFANALIQYRNAVAASPRSGEARLKLADAYAVTRDADNALKEYVRAADLLPDNVVAQARAGKALLERGQW